MGTLRSSMSTPITRSAEHAKTTARGKPTRPKPSTDTTAFPLLIFSGRLLSTASHTYDSRVLNVLGSRAYQSWAQRAFPKVDPKRNLPSPSLCDDPAVGAYHHEAISIRQGNWKFHCRVGLCFESRDRSIFFHAKSACSPYLSCASYASR